MADPIRASDAQAIIDVMKALHLPQQVNCQSPDGKLSAEAAVIPDGMRLVSIKNLIDEWRDRPERREGTVPLLDLDSFIAYVNRYKGADTLTFGNNDRTKPALVTVIDYHTMGFDGLPAWCEHRARYDFPLSDEWKLWHSRNAVPMGQSDFAAFVEDHIDDVMAPPIGSDGLPGGDPLIDSLLITLGGTPASPAKLLELSRGLAVLSNDKVINAVNQKTGEATIRFETSHTDTNGGKVDVPPLFLIGIPVFTNGPRYKIAARLRYRLSQGAILWFYQLYRTEKVFDHAFSEAVQTVRESTETVTILGRPE